MWKRSAFVFCFTVALAAAATLIEQPEDLTWYCQTICDGCHGKYEYEPKTSTCKCTVSKEIEAHHVDVIKNTAHTIGMDFVLVTTKQKRETDVAPPPPHKPLVFRLRSRLLKPSDDPIVGQMNPSIYENESYRGNKLGSDIFPLNPAPGLGPGFGPGYDHSLASSLTKALLTRARMRLDGLLDKIHHHPYDPKSVMDDAQKLRNQMRQVTQVNVNLRPNGPPVPFLAGLAEILPGLVPPPPPLLGRAKAAEVTSSTVTTEVTTSGLVVQPKELIGDEDEDESSAEEE